jgi:hypothetical protein
LLVLYEDLDVGTDEAFVLADGMGAWQPVSNRPTESVRVLWEKPIPELDYSGIRIVE